MSAPVSLACMRARAALQARLDDDPLAPLLEIEAHLGGCARCRDLARELAQVQEALRAGPLLRFPDQALEQVWDRTVRTTPRLLRDRRGRRAAALWGGLAAAGVLGAMLLATPRGLPHRDEPSREEVLRAAADLRFVLNLTDREIRHQGTRALREVLDDEVAPAMRRADR